MTRINRRRIHIHPDQIPEKEVDRSHKMPSFNERYYREKFGMKRNEFENYLAKNPYDTTAQKQIQFIDMLVRENEQMGKNVDWANIWNTWAKHGFMPYNSFKD